jgi:YD repeat-containing protein
MGPGAKKQYGYDTAGRRTSVTDALSNMTSFKYDAVGNQLSMTDANGNTSQYQYDALNRRTRVTYADSIRPDTTLLGVRFRRRMKPGATTPYAPKSPSC